MKKCIYCKCELSDDSIVDFCKICGYKVWGHKMYNAIVQNMLDAQDRGDLAQGEFEEAEQKTKKSHKREVQEQTEEQEFQEAA